MRHVKFLRFVLLIALLVIAINPVQAQEEGTVVVPAGENIKIAVQTDLTNAIPEFGLDIWQGAQVAAAMINEEGGVLGFPIELFVEDDRCTGDDATTVANRVVSDPQVVAIVGPICSGATVAASDVYEEARIVMVSPSATAAEVTSRGLTVINRTAPLDAVQGVYDANYIYKVLGARTLAALHDNDTYGLGLAQTVADEFERLGGEVVAFEGINVDDQDFRPVLTPLAALEPDVIFFGGYTQQAVLLIPQKNDVGLEDVIFFGPDGIYGQATIDGAGEAAEGVYASFTLSLENEEFDARYEEMFDGLPDELGPFHAQAADALGMIAAAIEATAEVNDAGDLVIDREALIEAVRGTENYEGLTGVLTCAENGDCGTSIIVVNVVEDGEFVQLEAPEDLLEMEVEE
ncbi:MAG: branched-chain amino acid ABC transporter substrate-binding protein [Chloroflexi bacterium]|nr:MAG: branched-chain amino acid ABC transporter substrate-binding protein [Chloroflexota bacterium]